MKIISLLLMLEATLLSAQSAPTDLAPVLATRSSVRLEWKAASEATGYRVERKAAGGEFSLVLEIVPPAEVVTRATDTQIDPYETYSYRVVALHNQERSEASNVVTVGPPPKGFSVPAPLADYPEAKWLGAALRMAYDANGDPAFAYLKDEEPSASERTATKLYFLSWNRTRYRWNDVVTVATVGALRDDHSQLPISFARDASTNQWAMAHETTTADRVRVDVHFSNDDGATWLMQTFASEVTPEGPHPPSAPSIGLANGKAHVIWLSGNDGFRYATGELQDQGATPATTLIPLLANARTASGVSHLVVDPKGVPLVALVQDDVASDYNRQISVWRPGKTPVKVMDTQNFQIDDPAVVVAYAGGQPRLLARWRRDDQYFSKYDHSMWLAASEDEGASWAAPVNLPADGETSLDPTLGLAFGPTGAAAVVLESNGGTGANVQCSTPKLLRSSDLKNWSVCGVVPAPLAMQIGYPSVLAMENGKLYVAFQNRSQAEGGPAPGVVLYREP